MSPAKVELSASPDTGMTSSMKLPKPAAIKEPALPTFNASSFTSGEWANVVHGVAPYLSAQGLRRALAILDQATQNVQRLKALEEVIRSTHEAEAFSTMGFSPLPYAQCAVTCMALQEQLRDQQLRLLVELQQLPCDTKSVRTDFIDALAAQASPCLLPPRLPANVSAGTTKAPETASRVAHGAGKDMQLPAKSAPRLAQAVPAQPPSQLSSWNAPKAQQPVGQSNRATARKSMATLSSSLQLLSDEDPDCLFIVRRINKLGFKAVRTLKRHFSAHGQVLKVLLAHSTVRQQGTPQCHARRRPSSLGFVQMATAEGAQKILALGDEQEVDGILIRVQRFERQRFSEAVAEEADAAGEAEEQDEHEEGQGSSSDKLDKVNDHFLRQTSEASTYSGATCVSNSTGDSGPDSDAA